MACDQALESPHIGDSALDSTRQGMCALTGPVGHETARSEPQTPAAGSHHAARDASSKPCIAQQQRRINATPSRQQPASSLPCTLRSPRRATCVDASTAQALDNMRKVCSCTALLSTYPAVPSSHNSARSATVLSLEGSNAAGEHQLEASSHLRHAGVGEGAAQAAGCPCEVQTPRTSLITLAQAGHSQDTSSGCRQRELQLRSSDTAAFGGNQPHHVDQGATAAHDREEAAAVSALMDGTPFTRMQGLPAALHAEAFQSGFHKPSRVAIRGPALARNETPQAGRDRSSNVLADLTRHLDEGGS